MRRIAALLVAMVGVSAAADARAADMPEWRPQPQPVSQFSELASGWYVRGDFGYALYNAQSGFPGATSEDYRAATTMTAGFGVKYQWLRGDITFDHRENSKVTVSSSAGQMYTARLSGDSFSANGYLDMGTWGGFTPYVGAGIGVAKLASTAYQNVIWSAMGGVSYQVTQSIVIDAGYRYTWLGEAAVSNLQTNVALTNIPPRVSDLYSHEARIGFRYLID